MRSVFISYAANDPDWLAKQVRELADGLQQQGAAVLLDEIHKVQVGRRLSIDEWRQWMRKWVQEADHILCLASPRYLKAAERDVDDPAGYGVAFESLRLIHQLYETKGHNDGRIVVARREGVSDKTVVTEDFRFDCPLYKLPIDLPELLQDLTRPTSAGSVLVSAGGAGSDSGRGGTESPEDEPAMNDLIRRQESFAVEHLEAAPAFFDTLKADVRLRLPRLPWLAGDASGFVQGLCSADKDFAHKLMWAVRRVLTKPGQSAVDEATRQAAIAVYMLCACRWTKAAELRTGAGRIVRVPQMLLNPIAVLSATLFGGGIFLRQHKGNEPVAANVFEVSPVLGESPQVQLLREIYAKLCPDDAAILDHARRDSTAEEEQLDMVSAIRARINDIWNVEESSLTLVVNCPAVFEEAPWAADLQLKAFARDPGLVEDLFVISPRELHHEIKNFWRTLAQDEKSPVSARATDQTSPSP